MSVTKILWRQIIVIFAVVLITMWAATQCAVRYSTRVEPGHNRFQAARISGRTISPRSEVAFSRKAVVEVWMLELVSSRWLDLVQASH
jgi:hypothetical protein